MNSGTRRGLTILEVLVILIVVVVLFVVLMPFFFVPGGNSKHAAIKTACLSNLKQLSTGLLIYQSDYDDWLPRENTWMIDSWDYVKRYGTYQCPLIRKENKGYGYALNDKLAGRSLKKEKEPEKKVLVFESTNLKFNAHDPVTSLPNPGRHGGSNIVAFLDGHAKAYKTGAPIP